MLTFLVVSAAIPGAAQTPPVPPVDLFLGYQSLHIPHRSYPIGMVVGMSGALSDNKIVRLVGEVGVAIDQATTSTLNGTLALYHYGAGPRFTATAGRVHPYAQVLAGGVHTRADLNQGGAPFSRSGNAFMLQPGGGVIIPLTRTFSAMGEVNYRRVFFKGDPDDESTVFAGIRIAFR
jgi:hypothetical protein